jgi:acyl-CoA reductase-like NAD-dependent aldehyde dehydrogenase
MNMNLAVERQVMNPATGEVIAEISETPVEQVPKMLQDARNAFEMWSNLSIRERLQYIKQLRFYIVDHMEELVDKIVQNTGKVKTEAIISDILPTLDGIEFIEQHAVKILGKQKVPTPLLLFGKKSYVEYLPRGVVLIISPWNYPFQLSMIPMISALAGGNAVILKPSEITPLVGLMIEDLFEKVGFPKDVVQVAHGGKDLGAALVSAKPDYIFFTGSVRTGKIIGEQAAKHLIPTTLELGGKDPMIVFADANMERAVKGAVWGAFTNSGQVCMSTERLYVERPIYEEFTQKIIKEVQSLTQGISENDDIGSMTFPGQLQIIKEQLEDALRKGAKLLTGKKPEEWNISNGLFLEPTVVTNVSNQMDIVQEETFGPVLPIIPFDTEEEAIQLANESNYGLNASVWSSDLQKASRVASKLVSGNVVINDVMVSYANHRLPFGGVKESGIGRYHGEAGLRIFCHEKSVMVDSGQRSFEIHWYPYKGKFPLFLQLFKALFGKKKDWKTAFNAYRKLIWLSKKAASKRC